MPVLRLFFCCFFFNDTATTEIYTLSLHDALPICGGSGADFENGRPFSFDRRHGAGWREGGGGMGARRRGLKRSQSSSICHAGFMEKFLHAQRPRGGELQLDAVQAARFELVLRHRGHVAGKSAPGVATGGGGAALGTRVVQSRRRRWKNYLVVAAIDAGRAEKSDGWRIGSRIGQAIEGTSRIRRRVGEEEVCGRRRGGAVGKPKGQIETRLDGVNHIALPDPVENVG